MQDRADTQVRRWFRGVPGGRAPRSYGAVAPSGPFLKSVVGVDFPEIGSERGPISPAANSCAALRSLSAAQRMIIGFQDFAAVEALIPDLQPRAEGFGYA